MNHFNLDENISTTDRILRITVGMALLLATLSDVMPTGLSPSILPMLAAYLVLTAIMKWDPIGYVIEVVLRIFGQVDASSVTPPAAPKSTLRARM